MDLMAAFSVTGDDPFTSALLQAILLILLIRFLDLWEREPLWLITAMAVWGATGAIAIAGPVNTAWLDSMSPELLATFGPAIVAPLVEEIAKGIALVCVLLVSRWAAKRHRPAEFDGPADGLVYGAAVGLGFAFNENNFYFLNTATQENIEAGRTVLELREGFFNLGTMGHAIYTGIFGAGLGLATWSRTRTGQIGWPILGLGVAMLLHAFNNGFARLVAVLRYGYDEVAAVLLEGEGPAELVQQLDDTVASATTVVEVVNYLMVALFVGAILLAARYQQRMLRYELAEEASTGLIGSDELAVVTSYTRRLKWSAQLLIAGVRTRDLEQWRTVRRAHHDLAELAFLKWRLRRVGGDGAEVERRRRQITALRQQLQTAGQP